MAQQRGSERGVVKVASTALLAALGALLGVTGCSSDEGSGGEQLGTSRSRLICGKLNVCPPDDDCGVWACNLANQCVITKAAADGAACADASRATGVCVSGACCTGCVEDPKLGPPVCHPASTDVNFCGSGGEVCNNCDRGNTCEKYECFKNSCTATPILDKEPCSDNAGSCWRGSCCAGCIDANDACVANTVNRCGLSSSNGLVACKDCSDGEFCTTDACVNGACAVPVAKNNGTACPDGIKCDGAETCQGGKCTDQANFSCADNNACTSHSCNEVNGCTQTALNNVPCLDANLCNGSENCVTGTCTDGPDLVCNDNNVCTTDTCSGPTGCVFTKLNSGACLDNNVCDGAESCSNGACVEGTPLTLNDNNPCTIDSCDPVTGVKHVNVGDGTKCDDGLVCNGTKTCEAGQCVAGLAPNCDDANVCTNDFCDETGTPGCKHTNNVLSCSDGDLCTTNDKCNAGSCKGGPAPNCDDNEGCTTDSCNNGCQHVPLVDNAGCDDGNGCTTVDKCSKGKCLGSGGPTCEDSNACTQNTCDVNADPVCTNPAETNGTPCTFDKCHENSTCQAGACTAGALVNCDDSNPCTTDSCDLVTGCKHVPDNAAKCSDGDVCTLADACKAGVCVGTDVKCEALDECHAAGTCAPSTGVCDDPRAEDGKPCTGGSCDKGKCVLDPIGAGGAGGETGAGGEPVVPGGAGDGPVAQGGDTSGGGTNAVGGEPAVPGSGGSIAKGGSSSPGDGGAGEEPIEDAFVRTPGGCSCSVPSSGRGPGLAWLAGLAVAAAAVARRRRSPRAEG